MVTKVSPALLEESYEISPYVRLFGYSFTTGYTITSKYQLLLHDNKWWSWDGTIVGSKTVAPSSTPEGSGGIGAGAWIDRTQYTLRSELANESSDILISGKTAGYIVDHLDYMLSRKIFAKEYCTLDGVADDSAGLSSAISYATALYNSNPAAGKVLICLEGIVLLKSTVTFNPAKVAFIGPCTVKSFSGGTYTSSRLLVPTDDGDAIPVTFAAYYNRQLPIFRHVIFKDVTNTLTLFHSYTTNTDSNNNPVGLHTVDSCTFEGFASIFTHGRGAWGWTWNQCGAVVCSEWMHITTEQDTYERHTFFGCMWHNGGTAFYINNPNGKVYWYGGSCDYSSKLANIVNGHLYFDGHIEFNSRTVSLVDIIDGTCSLSGALYIVTDTNSYSLVNQSKDYQLNITNLVVASNETSPVGRISNKRFTHNNVTLMSVNAETYFNIRLDYPADMRFPTITTYGTGVSVSQLDTGISFTSSVAAGGEKGAYIDIPLNLQDKKVGWKILYANSGEGVAYLSKGFMPENKAYTVSITAGDVVLNVTGGEFLSSVEMQQIPTGIKYLRFQLNLNNLSTIGSVNIADFGLFSL